MKKENKNKSDINHFAKCEMNMSALNSIMEKNIKGDLDCLEENLNLFINVVKTDRPGNLSLKELKQYINKHLQDFDKDMLESLDVIFALNSVFLGDHKHYIAKKNVSQLIDLFKYFNEVMVEKDILNLFKNNEKVTFSEHNQKRLKILEAFSLLANKVKKIPKSNGNTAKINIIKTLISFKNKENKQSLEKAIKLLPLKKIFFGGNSSFLTAGETQKLLDILGRASLITYDFMKFSKIENLELHEIQIITLIKENLHFINEYLYAGKDNNEAVLTISDIVQAIHAFTNRYDRYFTYKKELIKVKEILFGHGTETFTVKDIKEFVSNILLKNVDKGLFFYKTFRLNEYVLQNGEDLDFNLSSFTMNPKEELYLLDFNRIMKSYRFFKGSNISPFYKKEIVRDPMGLFIVAFLEDMTKKVVNFYAGVFNKQKNQSFLTLENIQSFLKDFSVLLENEKFLESKYLGKTSETIFLMSGLFQSNSNGDAYIGYEELVQFVSTIYTSNSIKNLFMVEVRKHCEVAENGSFDPKCFRKNFVTFMQEVKSDGAPLAIFYPRLMEFLNSINNSQQARYIESLEKFSRSCVKYKGHTVRMLPEDIFLVFGGLQSIEQTFIRFDTDENNLLELKEIDDAFLVYRDSVEAMIPEDMSKSYTKSIFLYMMMYKKIPKGTDFLLFLASRRKYTPVNRFTLSGILKVLSEQSRTHKFECNLTDDMLIKY